MSKVVVILVMAEEKWREADFLRREIESRGFETVMLDMGLLGEPQGHCDITREEVILASGRNTDEVASTMLYFLVSDSIRSISGTSFPAASMIDNPSPSNGSPSALILFMELVEEKVGIHTTLAPSCAEFISA